MFYKEYKIIPAQIAGMYVVISPTSGGSRPLILAGLYTTPKAAMHDIDKYLAKRATKKNGDKADTSRDN